jgi:hypothetical protein
MLDRSELGLDSPVPTRSDKSDGVVNPEDGIRWRRSSCRMSPRRPETRGLGRLDIPLAADGK